MMRRITFVNYKFFHKLFLHKLEKQSLQSRLLIRHLRTSSVMDTDKNLVHRSYFENEDKDKETFLEAINKFRERERNLRGHVEFILSALNYLEEYGVHKDIEVYKGLLDLMPKGTMIPLNLFQQEFYHYPKHQDCGLTVLAKMEKHGVIPDSELKNIMENAFGKKAQPCLKLYRMLYWMPKFKYACPWKLPVELPNDLLELAKLAIIQINSVDPASKITVMETKEVEGSIDDTWIVSAMSPHQMELIAQHPLEKPIKVEGPFRVILHDQQVFYFILRAEPGPPRIRKSQSEIDDVSSIWLWMSEEDPGEEREISRIKSVHEQEDGTILASCATGTSSRDSLLSWIRLLEKSVPDLSGIPILFSQSSPYGEVVVSPASEKTSVNT